MSSSRCPHLATRRALLDRALGGLASMWGGSAFALEPNRPMGVVYPDLGEPYRQIFGAILQGIEDRLEGRVLSFAMKPNVPPVQVADEIRRRGVQGLIGLGRGSMGVVSSFVDEMAVLLGCVVSLEESELRNYPVFSLAPDPALLFARLKRLRPGIRRVHMVYDPKYNGWLMKLAREAVRTAGLELVTQEASDQTTALRIYSQVIPAADTSRDALWLPQDPTTGGDSAVLPLVLTESWNRSLVVFSSHLAHVKRGALFSLFPDNRELGKALAGSAQRLVAMPKSLAPVVLPLRQTLAAINVRTAAHLGVNVEAMQAGFDLVYPTS